MSDEAVLKVETHIPINFTCSTTATIEKGAICKMTTPMTAVLSDSHNDVIAGIAQSEKLAADTTQNSVAIYRGGVFRVTCSGSGSKGAPMVTDSTDNYVIAAGVNEENIIGYMLEDFTNTQTKLMELHPTTMNLA